MSLGVSLQQPSAWDQAVAAALDFTATGGDTSVKPDIIRDEADLAEYLATKFGIVIPNKACCTGHQPPWEAFCDAYFARSPVTVWKASRGFGGKSQTLALLGNVEAATLRADVNVLGGTGQQSERVLEAMDRFWKHPSAPRELLASEPAKKETRFVWGNVIRALMASTASVRGPHPQRLRMDEVDEMDLHILDAAMGQTMSTPGIPAQTVLSSTHHYPDHTMTEILRRAHDRGWPVYEWCVASDTLVDTPNGPVPICRLKAGDEVYAFDGNGFTSVRIADAWSNGVKRTIRIDTPHGVIECTPEHKLLTARGWVEAGAIDIGDQIVSGVLDTAGALGPQSNAVVSSLLSPAESSKVRHGDGQPMRLRRAEAGSIEAVPRLLPDRLGEAEHQRARSDDAGAGDDEAAAIVAGVASGGAIRGNGAAVCAAVSDRPIRGGLLSAGSQHGRRSLRPDAPEQSGGAIQGRGAGRDDRGSGASVRDSLRPRYAPVVAIAAGRTVDVWDIAVPQFHSFLANGLVAHNCWRETVEPHGWLPQSEVARKRLEVTTAMWEAEYDLQEPSADNRAIVTEAVERMFKRSLGVFPGTPGKLVQIEGPVRGGVYRHGADWAKKQDYTQVVTVRVDVTPMRIVAWLRQRREPWPKMVGYLEDRLDEYGGKALHDGTGLGDVIDGYLTRPATPFILVGRDRQDLFSEYVSAIERGEIEAPVIDSLRSEHKFATTKDLYEPSGHPPDGIVAGALGYRASRTKETVAAIRAGDAKPSALAIPSDARRRRREAETAEYDALKALVETHGPATVEAIKRLQDPAFELPEELRGR
jgi:hypothetical protein